MRCVGPTLSEKELQKFQDQYSFHPDMEEQAEFYNLISNPIRLKIINILREKERFERYFRCDCCGYISAFGKIEGSSNCKISQAGTDSVLFTD